MKLDLNRKVLSLILFLLGTCGFAIDLRTSFSVDTLWATCVSGTNEGQLSAAETSAFVDFDFYEENSACNIDLGVTYDALQENLNKDTSIRIKEANWTFSGNGILLKVGRQISAWGKADGLTVCDVVCPQDMSKVYAEDASDSRLGIDSILLNLGWENISADFYWIPVFTPSVLPLDGKSIVSKTMFADLVNAGFSKDCIVLPEKNLSNSEWAGRICANFPFMDFAFYGFYGFDDVPVVSFGLSGPSARYKKLKMIGIDAAVPLGAFVFRMESAFYPDRELQSSNMMKGSETLNQFSALAGFDWTSGDFMMTAQYYVDSVLVDASNLSRDKTIQKATCSLSYSCFEGNLKIEVSGVVGLNCYDSLIKPTVKYSVNDYITVTAGALVFNGCSDSEYGAMKNLTSVFIKGTVKF